MVCIYCKGGTKVTNSRTQQRTNSTWRRRQCLECDNLLTTIETIDLSKALVIINEKSLEPFSRDALFISIYGSLRHRKTALDDSASLTSTIVAKLVASSNNALVSKAEISQLVSKVLERFDKVAAVHYKAFHPTADRTI